MVQQGLRFEVVPTYYKMSRAINRYGKMNNPLFHFTVVGILLGLGGFCLGLYVLFEWFAGIEHLFLGILTILLIITGRRCGHFAWNSKICKK